MLVGKLKGLDEAEGFVDGASHGEIVDGDLSEGTLGVDEEETTKRYTGVLDQDTVIPGNLHRLVRDELELEVGSESSLVTVRVGPGEMRVFRIAGDGEDFSVEFLKVGETLVEREDLGRADEGEVEGVEEEDEPFALVLVELDGLS